MKDNFDTCHKCDSSDTICLGSQEVGYSMMGTELKQFDYECESCGATWDVTFELTPVSRENHES